MHILSLCSGRPASLQGPADTHLQQARGGAAQHGPLPGAAGPEQRAAAGRLHRRPDHGRRGAERGQHLEDRLPQ